MRNEDSSDGTLPVAEVQNLTIRYGKFLAVDDLSFSVPRGEIFGFIGPNGAGKTSTFKVLATLLKPNVGYAKVCGHDVIKEAGTVRHKIGYAPDFFGVYDDLTASEYLHFFAAAYSISRGDRKQIVADVLALTDLTEKVNAPVDGLSRGMKQRLGLARVLLHDPELLILDEPASGLDPRARIEMRELLKELQSMGKTILVSSHILHELGQFCTRIGIIEAGKLVAQGSLDEIYQKLDLQRVVHVQLANASEELNARIEQLPAVTKIDRSPDRLAIHLKEGEMPLEDLHDALYKMGARVRMFQASAMDMETAFMKLTEGKTA
ncbi:MAG: ABC-2 type transport system ATP-binding protein [Verrucomicrobiales bacterium]|jgi:ABC-2 type transport system ATP-binding protein